MLCWLSEKRSAWKLPRKLRMIWSTLPLLTNFRAYRNRKLITTCVSNSWTNVQIKWSVTTSNDYIRLMRRISNWCSSNLTGLRYRPSRRVKRSTDTEPPTEVLSKQSSKNWGTWTTNEAGSKTWSKKTKSSTKPTILNAWKRCRNA